MKVHTEKTFETAIVGSLVENGYKEGTVIEYDKDAALNKEEVIQFLESSQPDAWQQINAIHKNNTNKNLTDRLLKELDNRGSLDVLRNGFTDYGVKFRMAYFKPETSLNPELQRQYDKNILTVTRQVKYSKANENSLDLVLFINGIPAATVEIKNQFTGQNIDNAKRQYKYDRDPKELIFQFKKRTLVHFVVDADEVYLTTRLNGSKTFYLPFNLGNNNGAGNPVNPDGYKTSYLWEKIWQRDSWLDIIGKYLHLQVEEEHVLGKKVRKETMIFPRYHQLDVVRGLSKDSKENGSGKNYLIEHSAGSGKSNSIAWLAYRLSNLHNDKDEKVFNSVIVVTDRRILDSQLQDTIYQFEHKSGVVQKIDKNSQQLADAITKGANIIITTLQKFPEIIKKVGEVSDKTFAVIVDEAHSSQGGEASKKLKEVLSGKTLEEAADDESDNSDEENYEDEIRKSMLARSKQTNLSFFAFTATPKAKTLEVFGVPDTVTGKPKPFHLYSMRQAIEEGFILDVLKGYTTYKTFYKLNKKITDDPSISKKKGARAVARFVSLHPHNLSQKTQVIIEHFRRVVSKKIGGRAKAMLVTSSRLHAVRYKNEFDHYIREKGYNGIKTLVAFSGTVNSDGVEYSEAQMNGFGEKELPAKFESNEYQVLIVAEKYQTGFDQPLLHTMYVDKKLSGVKAVQTLSRLNRTCTGKEDTFILDFVNDYEDIQKSFQPYYELTTISDVTDPNHVYDLKQQIESAQVIWINDVEEFTKVYYSPYFTAKDQGKMNTFIDYAVERYKHLPTEPDENLAAEANQRDFKHALLVFTRLYAFLSQIVVYNDIELEKYFTYCKYLLNKLPRQNISDAFTLNDEVALEYYRLQKVGEMDIELEQSVVAELDPLSEAGMRKLKEEKVPLSEIIKVVNDRFGTDFKDADKLLIQQIVEDCITDEQLANQAKSNTLENFKFPFDDIYINKWLERMDQNKEMFSKVMDDEGFSTYLKGVIMKEVYERLR